MKASCKQNRPITPVYPAFSQVVANHNTHKALAFMVIITTYE
ncbi:hypothetical protein CLV58_11138 [Spirosoma oryzae]|uniref:Uncharacterized protein n=1 Tax=Spirosoma oryzae TaxID=1469603 RepID=A0A2T0SUA8_9BACT|nr:hypothetical protein [Spirosoma oryzae]PRY37001.1 hypothetical protein CLV58_11138 [Spirosoma oryzae]